jgi:hypothetical protein
VKKILLEPKTGPVSWLREENGKRSIIHIQDPDKEAGKSLGCTLLGA